MDSFKGASAILLAIIAVSVGVAFLAIIIVVGFFLRVILGIAFAIFVAYWIIRAIMEAQKK